MYVTHKREITSFPQQTEQHIVVIYPIENLGDRSYAMGENRNGKEEWRYIPPVPTALPLAPFLPLPARFLFSSPRSLSPSRHVSSPSQITNLVILPRHKDHILYPAIFLNRRKATTPSTNPNPPNPPKAKEKASGAGRHRAQDVTRPYLHRTASIDMRCATPCPLRPRFASSCASGAGVGIPNSVPAIYHIKISAQQFFRR